MNDAARNRLRYKTMTSFALFFLAIVMIARLWMVAPPSARTAPAYVTAIVLAGAALWRGVLFARGLRQDARA
jgi:hypothetical protein